MNKAHLGEWSRHILHHLTMPAIASTASTSKPRALTRPPKETQYSHHLPSACPREWHFALERQQEQVPSKVAATKADQNIKHIKTITRTYRVPVEKVQLSSSLALSLRDAPARVVCSCCVKAPDSISSRCPSGPSILKYPNASECIPFPIHFHVCLHCFTLESHFV